MQYEVINVKKQLSAIKDYWQPEIINRYGFRFRFVKLLNDYGWHTHEYSDKVLLVIEGEMTVDFADRRQISLKEQDMVVIPKQTSHRPYSSQGCSVVLIELPDTNETENQ